MSAIHAVIFDIGNVLLRFDFDLALRKLATHCDPAAEAIVEMIEPAKSAYESGQMSRADFQARIRTLLRYTGSDEEFISAWEDIFTENQPMVALVHELHGRLPLYLLSNTNDIHIDFILRSYPVFRLFTDAVYSYAVKASKPDPAIYEIAARQFGVAPDETIFIDDLLPNVEAARESGFQVHHYHHERHADLLERLRQGGVPTGS